MHRILTWLSKIPVSFDRCLFDFGAGELHMEKDDRTYPTIEECWQKDWENIGGDFHRAVDRLASGRKKMVMSQMWVGSGRRPVNRRGI